jgi:N4-gp56 family major capsid protein
MPVTAVTGTAQVATDTAAYDRAYWYALRPALHFDRCAEVQPTNQTHPGSSVVFNVSNDHAVSTTPLTELTDPAATAASDSIVTVTLDEYGRSESVSSKLRGTAYLSEMLRASNRLGYNAGVTIDTLARDVLVAGTQVDFSGAATSRATVDAAHVLTADEVRVARTKMVDGNVQPYGQYYKAFIAALVAYDLRKETGAAAWRDPHVHSGNRTDDIWNGSIGPFEGFDFIETSRLSAASLGAAWQDAGVGNVDAYPTIFLGHEALAKVFPIVGEENFGAQPHLGLSPVTDSMRRFQGAYWYWLGGYGRFRETSLYRWESASSIGANT